MEREQVYNFAPGPSTMPDSALKTAAAELLNFRGSGMSVMASEIPVVIAMTFLTAPAQSCAV